MDGVLVRQPLGDAQASTRELCSLRHPRGYSPVLRRNSENDLKTLWSVAPSFVGLGFASGCVFSTYLTAGGYLGEKLGSPLLLGFQTLVVNIFNLVVVLAQELLDDPIDQWLGVERTYCFRIVCAGLVASAALFVVPLCTTLPLVLLAGAVLSFCSLTQLSAGMQLSSVVTPGGGTLVSLGMSLGGLLPVVTTSAFNFAPGCDVRTAILLFGVGSFVGAGCTVWWAGELCMTQWRKGTTATVEESPEGHSSSHSESNGDDEMGEAVRGAYKAMSEPSLSPSSLAWGPRWEMMCGLVPLGIFVSMSVGFAIVPLFTIGSAWAAQVLCLAKAGGDCLGRLLAVAHTARCNSQGYTGPWVRHSLAGFIAIRAGLCAVMATCLLSRKMVTVSPASGGIVLAIFTLGTYALAMLDLDSQMAAGGKAERKAVQRWNLVMMFAGQLAGVLVGITLRWHVHRVFML